MQRQVRDRLKGAVPVQIQILLGMVILIPGAVRGRIVHAEIEGISLLPQFAQIFQSLVRNQIRDIPIPVDHLAVLHHIRVEILTAAPRDGIPFLKPMLGMYRIPHMPLTAQRTGVAVAGQHIRIGGKILQVWNRLVFVGKYRIALELWKLLDIDVAASEPVLHTVGGGNGSRHDGCTGRRTDR